MPAVSAKHARPTRRQFLRLLGGGLGGLLLPGCASAARAATESGVAAEATVSRYYSRPDLTPPTITVATAAPTASPGYLFLAPASGPGQYGPLIIDDSGQPIWFLPVANPAVYNFRAQQFAGRPVLTWWEGVVTSAGYGQGDYVIADSSYQELKRFGAANGYRGDLHEFVITSRGTALISIYNPIAADLTAYGGNSGGTLLEGVIQELDLDTGKPIFEWRSSQHVDPGESNMEVNNALWDYFHLNSIGVLSDGNLLISARHTSALYKLDRRSGEVLWRLGGKHSDFELGPGASFAYQHDARGHAGDMVSVFDDGAYGGLAVGPSRGLLLQLDTTTMTATMVRANQNPQGGQAVAEGSAQILPDGGMLVGWGTVPSFSEFSAAGALRFDAHLAGAGTSYRVHRDQWTADPSDKPAIGTFSNGDGSLNVYASWNGATNVSHWQFSAGPDRNGLKPLRTVRRNGFETRVRLATAPPFVAVSALDSAGGTLGTSTTIQT